MTYILTREELLQLAKEVYEQAAHGYLDLKDGSCERILSNFLLDKKSSAPNTNLFLNTNAVDTNSYLNAEIYTITESFVARVNT
mgnify:CR=1 FL=1